MTDQESIPNLLTIHQLAKKYPFLTETSIRWMLYKDLPGLEKCLIRMERKIFFDEKLFFIFLKENSEKIKNKKMKKKDPFYESNISIGI